MKRLVVIVVLVCLGVALGGIVLEDSLLGISRGTLSVLGSSIPENGDLNPYGVWIVRNSIGDLVEHNILVSNFNDFQNLQGRGSTIIQFRPDGKSSQVFAQINETDIPEGNLCPGGIGLTAALITLRRGWVIVGSLPTDDGTSQTAHAGCLLILDAFGNVVSTLWGEGISGPWELEVLDLNDRAYLFVSNVFDERLREQNKGTGRLLNSAFILRIELLVPLPNELGIYPTELSRTIIGSDFALRADAEALLIGPTGLALNGDRDQLYVADSLFNRIAAIPNPLFRLDTAYAGRDISANGFLNRPLGLIRAPQNEHFLATNAEDGNLVELDREGNQLDFAAITPNGADALFDLAIDGNTIYFVDDHDNTLSRLVLPA